MKKWTKEEVNYLINNYSDKTNKELSIFLNKEISVIESKRYTLNLYKSKEHKSKMIGNRNKIVGRDLSFNFCKNEALKYKTRGEFQLKDSSVYVVSRTNGWLDIICSHMIKNQYSIPQLILSEIIKSTINNDILYNTRKIIKPYEIDIFVPKYNLAFEYDGKGWHLNNINDEIKNNLCKEKNIKLIRIVENNRNYISDIKEQFIKKLDEINNYCNLNIKKDEVNNISIELLYEKINTDLLDDKKIKEIISKYISYSIFIHSEKQLYIKLKQLNQLEKYTTHLIRNKINWTEEKIKEEVNKYEYLYDFYTNSPSCYLFAKRHSLDYLLTTLKYKNKPHLE